MTTRSLVLGLLVLIVGVTGATLWQRAAAPADASLRYAVSGLVTAPPDGVTVVIAHDDIPGFMPAMTMPFTAATPEAVAQLTPGDRVTFTLVVGQDASRIDDVAVTGRDPGGLRLLAAQAAEQAVRLSEGDLVPPFRLIDQSGAAVTEADLQGVTTVVSFIFTRCPLPEFCPLIMKRLIDIQRATAADPALSARTRLMAVTLDPAFDIPEILEAYGRAKEADFSRFRLVTGPAEEIDALTAAFTVVVRPSDAILDHTLATVVIGPDGRVAGLFRGNAWKLEEVMDLIRAQVTR